ncbi:hypothetical protein JTE90_025492 [Oedothorax gibbosus]|uniref:Uncharacterized protein n=1 Tax=Oedothorax gibbosus TaxID=931172 RepID=A0AAV6UX66_9ARAC|nr:hypothetical protein JTE90_025492 [Oedothorax gibbosus]
MLVTFLSNHANEKFGFHSKQLPPPTKISRKKDFCHKKEVEFRRKLKRWPPPNPTQNEKSKGVACPSKRVCSCRHQSIYRRKGVA